MMKLLIVEAFKMFRKDYCPYGNNVATYSA
jgi:hypothetical protein